MCPVGCVVSGIIEYQKDRDAFFSPRFNITWIDPNDNMRIPIGILQIIGSLELHVEKVALHFAGYGIEGTHG